MIILETSVNEESALLVNIIITDSTDTVFPLASMEEVRWQLSDKYGTVIGVAPDDRTFANGLITENPIVLSGDDLAVDDTGMCRLLAIKVTYNSDVGAGLKGTEEAEFKIDDLVNID